MAALCLSLLLMANSFTALFALMAGGVLVLSTARDAQQVLMLGLWLLRMLLAAVVCNLYAFPIPSLPNRFLSRLVSLQPQ